MRSRAFTDDWDGLHIYDTDWRLVDAGEQLRNAALYQDVQRESGILPEQSLTVPHRIVLELTGACNLQCSFCYNASGTGAPSLPDEELVGVLAQIVELDALDVVLTGGEPLVRPAAVRAAVQTFEQFGIATQILTNGVLIDHDWARYFLDHGVLSVQVSIDGADPEAHDQIRGRPGAWRAAVEAVNVLSSAGCYTVMGLVLTQQNLATLEDYVDLAFCLGAEHVLIGDVMPRGRAMGSLNEVRVDDAQYLDATRRLRAKAAEYEGLMRVNVASDEALSLKMQLARMQTGFVVRADGSIVGSCLLPLALGSVLESPLRTIWSEAVAGLASNPEVADFVAPLRVSAVGEERLLRVDHVDFIGEEEH